MMFYIYEITNNLNGNNYIGQHHTNNLNDKYMGSGKALCNAKKKYGIENFSKKIIAVCETKENADILEKVFIKIYRLDGKAEYNIAEGGSGAILYGDKNGFYGKHHSEETKKILSEKCANFGESNGFYGKTHTEETIEKIRKCHLGKVPSESARKHMSESQKGRKHSEETKRKISESNKGKIVLEETRKKLSESHKGQVPYNKGKYDCISEETKRKMSDAKKGKIPWNKGKTGIFSKETIEKMKEHAKLRCGEKGSFYGKVHSEETKKKISLANKGKTAWNKGKHGFVMSEETKKKLSESGKGIYWWNNGIIQVKSKICPEGFVRGKVKKTVDDLCRK